MLKPTRKLLSWKNRHHSSSRRIPFVWNVFSIRVFSLAYFFCTSTERRKKSSPIRVGSPPCQAIVTLGTRCPLIVWRMNSSITSSVIRKLLSGYSPSFFKKKQYAQSRLHCAPVGFAMT